MSETKTEKKRSKTPNTKKQNTSAAKRAVQNVVSNSGVAKQDKPTKQKNTKSGKTGDCSAGR